MLIDTLACVDEKFVHNQIDVYKCKCTLIIELCIYILRDNVSFHRVC